MTATRRFGVALALALGLGGAAGLGLSGCDAPGFCLDCEDAAGTGDGGIGDGGTGDGGQLDAAPDGPTSDAGPCVPTGAETCDGVDDDCDGETDEGVLPLVGEACGTAEGPCEPGTYACDDGELVCAGGAINPTAEACDGVDNDCDGDVDEGNPGGGLSCGSPVGECQSGVTRCDLGTHAIVCDGEVGPAAETCNGRDDDCDGTPDDGTSTNAPCGPATSVGLCERGQERCVGGQVQCVGAVYPQVEDCDALETSDRDCDGDPINGFDTDGDVHNCGGCGISCSVANAFEGCDDGDCEIAACATDFWDADHLYSTGCEYGPCEFQGAEDCNQSDDDCDGQVDEDLTPPGICQQAGACAGAVASCEVGGWECQYDADVSLDADGQIEPETACDDVDNDCDGDVDEAFPLLGIACDDGDDGVCKDSGVYVCNPAGTGVVCDAVDDDAGVGTAEACDGEDDDCDGDVDEGAPGAWVDVGAYEIFAFEASRPDATTSTAGLNEDRACSKPDALPWTGITHDDAQEACADLGARLCTEAEWQAACRTTQTFAQPSSVIVREAESFNTSAAPCSDSWSSATAVAGFSGTGYMTPGPDNGNVYAIGGNGNCNGSDNAQNRSARLNYTINFPTTGTWYVWIRGTGPNGSGDSVHAGLDGATTSTADKIGSFPSNGNWTWLNHDQDNRLDRATINVPTTGNHTFNLFMREDGVRIDRIILTSDASFAPTNPGPDAALSCLWSYDSSCRTYQPDTCNGNDHDTSPGTAGDQDAVLPTATLDECFADWGAAGHVFDMSGNVKEWTAQRSAGVNPIRGGASNNTGSGITCDFNFLTADDAFFFDNVGFRCCR